MEQPIGKIAGRRYVGGNLDMNAIMTIIDPALKTKFFSQLVDKGPKANALDNAGNMDVVSFDLL